MPSENALIWLVGPYPFNSSPGGRHVRFAKSAAIPIERLGSSGPPPFSWCSERSFAMNEARTEAATRIRTQAALRQSQRPLAAMIANGDEDAIPNRAACFSKGLPTTNWGKCNLLLMTLCSKLSSRAGMSTLSSFPEEGDEDSAILRRRTPSIWRGGIRTLLTSRPPLNSVPRRPFRNLRDLLASTL